MTKAVDDNTRSAEELAAQAQADANELIEDAVD